MIRVIRLTALGALVLALGLGPIGCGGETSTAPKVNKASEDAKMEGKKKMAEEKRRGAAGGAGEEDKAKEDKPKSGDKDKKNGNKDK